MRRRRVLAAMVLAVTAATASANMVTDLPGGGHVEVETGSRGQVCMYITDDWGTVETTQCTSQPGTYTLTGRGGGQARVTINDFGGVSVNTGYFGDVEHSGNSATSHHRQQQSRHQPSEEEENSVRFGAFVNPRPVAPPVSPTEASPVQAPSAYAAHWPAYRQRRPLRRRPTPPPTLPPNRVPHLPNRARPTFGPLVLPQGPPVTEAGLGAVEIIASGPGQLTVFGDGPDTDGDSGLALTGPSSLYPTIKPLIARKKRNRFSSSSSSDNEEDGLSNVRLTRNSNGAATMFGGPGHQFSSVQSPGHGSVLNSRQGANRFSSVQSSDGNSVLNSQQGANRFSSVNSHDGSSVLNNQQGANRFSSVQSPDGSSVLNSQQGANRVSSVQSADGSSVITSQTPDGQRLGLVRSPDGSVVFSTFIDGRLVNVVQSSDGSSVVSANIDGRQVTALTSPTGQRLIAGAGPGHNLDAFFNRVMLQLAGTQ
ncbi:hypothetical protein FJT64_027275 [Amphibalanus amphitrite]|uniref:Uncharacterized protein n=1 Tax=Amphibalanus amphitrite TaxID=1232801 RepID=A0A6A4VZ15_AMPAM|nr:uncharacterized protein LOC122364237 [Amphibalanus amphitrite]KAF0300166.1 hypothetical protein FJT64_027275 [Amphibalanus amphitrite]